MVDVATAGRDGLFLAAGETYDMMIIDRLLPEVDGVSIVRTIRAAGVETPVLFLTALGGVDDRVIGLDAGGDDYLPKPFAFSELLARINALARRPPISSVETRLRWKTLRWTCSSALFHARVRRLTYNPGNSASSSTSCVTPSR